MEAAQHREDAHDAVPAGVRRSSRLGTTDPLRQALVRHNRRRVEHIVVKPRNEMPTLPAARHGVTRFFSNAPATEPTANAAAKLNLPTRRGYVAAQDAAYSFALCGPL